MRVDIDKENKMIYVWTDNSEEVNNVEKKYEDLINNKFKICVYESGSQDIKRNLLELLLLNR